MHKRDRSSYFSHTFKAAYVLVDGHFFFLRRKIHDLQNSDILIAAFASVRSSIDERIPGENSTNPPTPPLPFLNVYIFGMLSRPNFHDDEKFRYDWSNLDV